MKNCLRLMTRGLYLILIVAHVATGRTLAKIPERNSRSFTATAEWTLMIFMNGDNNLEPDALINFRQLAKVGSTDKVNAIVQCDRIAKYAQTTPDWSQTLRFRVTKGMDPIPANAVEDIGEANMGDPAVLRDFVRWAKQNYPAKHYMLVIWDHGQGWRVLLASLLQQRRTLIKSGEISIANTPDAMLNNFDLIRRGSGVASRTGVTAPFRSAPGTSYRSASNDETNRDVLYNLEIENGLEAAIDGQPLDVIGFDACLMSMAETAYALKDVGNYMVGSEELEPGLGWNYEDWLAAIIANPTQNGAAVAKTTVLSYQKYYTAPATRDSSTTMAALDLRQAQPLALSISALSDLLRNNIQPHLQAIIEARAATANYAPGYLFHHVDIAHFLKELRTRTSDAGVRSRIDAVLNKIQVGVIANYAGADRVGPYGSNGVAIYFPSTMHDYVNDPYAEQGYEKTNTVFPVAFVQRETWTDFLHTFWENVP